MKFRFDWGEFGLNFLATFISLLFVVFLFFALGSFIDWNIGFATEFPDYDMLLRGIVGVSVIYGLLFGFGLLGGGKKNGK